MRGESSTKCSSALKDFLSLHQLSARSELELMSLKGRRGLALEIIMKGEFMRVVQQGEPFAVQSQKSENGQMMKCNIVL